MTLAQEEDDVSRGGDGEGPFDGTGPVGNEEEVETPRLGPATGGDFLAEGHRILASGIFVGDYDHIAVACCDSPLEGALGRVALAGRTEDRDDARLCPQPERREYGLEG